MKIVFIINSRNNRLANVLPGLDKYCRQSNPGRTKFIFTQGKKHAIELAKQAAENDCDYLIAVGGDGTLHEVLNGVLSSNVPADEYPALGVLPYGSANDFARTAKISNSIEDLIGHIQSKTLKRIDVGEIILEQTGEVRYFINIAGVGLGAEVVKNMEQSSSILGAGFNYFKHILIGFLSYSKKEVRCSSSNWQWKGRLLQMAVANGRYFGNGICVAPDASLSDGFFQVTLFGNLSVWDYLKNLGKLKKGSKIKHSQVCYYTASEVLLESSDFCGIEADGEYVGLAPATIRVVPKAIRFLVPPEGI